MSKYASDSSWGPIDGFVINETVERIIKEKFENLSILAGPGSGKTELLAQRANYLLQTGACKSPQKILALSFKVDAATNIKNRVYSRCGRVLSQRFNSSTFARFRKFTEHLLRNATKNCAFWIWDGAKAYQSCRS